MDLGVHFLHLRKSNDRSNSLGVHEANCSLTQFNRVRGDIDLVYARTVHPLLIYGIWSLKCYTHSSPNKSLSPGKPGAVRIQCETDPEGRTKTKPLTSEGCCLGEIDYVTPNAKLSRHNALLLCILKTKRQ